MIPPTAKVMELEDAVKARRFLDDLSISVRKIIFSSFPGLSEQEREEIDQDVKLKILRMAARGKKIRNLRSYIWKMVSSTALDVIACRSVALCLDEVLKTRRPALESCLDGLSPESLYESKELLALADKALDALPCRRREAVLLHLQGLGLEEIAGCLRESVNAARHLVYRGLDDLKTELALLSGAASPRSRPARKAAKSQLEPRRT